MERAHARAKDEHFQTKFKEMMQSQEADKKAKIEAESKLHALES